MICIRMNYYHTPIANKSWKRRREREVLRIVTDSVAYAFAGHGFPRTEAQFDCREGFALTSVKLFVDGIDEKKAERVVTYINSNKSVYANFYNLTQPEPCGTM